MREDFLHYVWRHQAFSRERLQTEEGETLSVLAMGQLNAGAGPDFLEARLMLDDIEWHGPVEIHLKSSDWYAHKHQSDPAYEEVILHVVWEHDRPVTRANGKEIPVLVLAGRVDEALQQNYQVLMGNLGNLACADRWSTVREITQMQMQDQALLHRLETKADWMKEVYETNTQDWDVVAYQAVARAFGFRANRDPMWEVSRRLPLKLVLKHQHRLDQMEALVFGVAGLLTNRDQVDPYYQILQKEWQFLAHKYQLEAPNPPLPWRFGGVRPANQPHRRLAQFAALLVKEGRVFAMLREVNSLNELIGRLRVKTSPYWRQYYLFGKREARPGAEQLGLGSAHSIVINAVAPLLAAYGTWMKDPKFTEKAVELLQHIPAEDNAIIRRWTSLGVKVQSAFDTQALIGQYQAFCTPRRCLQCPVGVYLLRHGS